MIVLILAADLRCRVLTSRLASVIQTAARSFGEASFVLLSCRCDWLSCVRVITLVTRLAESLYFNHRALQSTKIAGGRPHSQCVQDLPFALVADL